MRKKCKYMIISGKWFRCYNKPHSYYPMSDTFLADVEYEIMPNSMLNVTGMRYDLYLTRYEDCKNPDEWDDNDIVKYTRKKWWLWGEEIEYWRFKSTWACKKEKVPFNMTVTEFKLDESLLSKGEDSE